MDYNKCELLVMKNVCWDSTFICKLVLQIRDCVSCQVHLHLEVSLCKNIKYTRCVTRDVLLISTGEMNCKSVAKPFEFAKALIPVSVFLAAVLFEKFQIKKHFAKESCNICTQ